MNDLLVMGESHDLRDLPHQVEACSYAESVSLLQQEMIEPDSLGVMLEDKGWPQFVLGETVDAEDPRMLERLEQLKFSLCRTLKLITVLLGGLGSDVIEPHPAFDVLEASVSRQPILIARPLADDLFEQIVADLTMPLGGPNSRLVHGLAYHSRRRPVMDPFRLALQTRALTTHDRRQNSWSCGGITRFLAIAETDAMSCCPLQLEA